MLLLGVGPWFFQKIFDLDSSAAILLKHFSSQYSVGYSMSGTNVGRRALWLLAFVIHVFIDALSRTRLGGPMVVLRVNSSSPMGEPTLRCVIGSLDFCLNVTVLVT
jgi:hypothetical protein